MIAYWNIMATMLLPWLKRCFEFLIMYTDIDKTGRVSVFELDPVEVKILAESIGHFIDAATSVRAIEGGQETTIRKAETMLRKIRSCQL